MHDLTGKLILGSGSPRRKELLSALGFNFDVLVKDTDESFDPLMSPYDVPAFLAEKKAKAILPFIPSDAIVLCADTVVVLDQEILGKPGTAEQAFEMLDRLSGRSHEVITGVCVASGEHQVIHAERTKVFFQEIPSQAISYYVDHFKPFDKAGSYGIQEWIGHHFVERIHGSYANVMGLPTHCIAKMLETLEQKKRESEDSRSV